MIETTSEKNIRWLTIARPRAANALDAVTLQALVAELDHALADGEVGAVVLRAAGERVFSAGADLKEYSDLLPSQAALERRKCLLRALLALVDFPKPLVAAVHAPAIGAGAMLPLACDEIVMAEDAWLSFPEIELDMPTPIGAVLIGHRSLRRTVQTLVQQGQRMNASDARLAGLVDEVVSLAELPLRSAVVADGYAPRSGRAFALNKRWMNRELRRSLIEAAEFVSANSSP